MDTFLFNIDKNSELTIDDFDLIFKSNKTDFTKFIQKFKDNISIRRLSFDSNQFELNKVVSIINVLKLKIYTINIKIYVDNDTVSKSSLKFITRLTELNNVYYTLIITNPSIINNNENFENFLQNNFINKWIFIYPFIKWNDDKTNFKIKTKEYNRNIYHQELIKLINNYPMYNLNIKNIILNDEIIKSLQENNCIYKLYCCLRNRDISGYTEENDPFCSYIKSNDTLKFLKVSFLNPTKFDIKCLSKALQENTSINKIYFINYINEYYYKHLTSLKDYFIYKQTSGYYREYIKQWDSYCVGYNNDLENQKYINVNINKILEALIYKNIITLKIVGHCPFSDEIMSKLIRKNKNLMYLDVIENELENINEISKSLLNSSILSLNLMFNNISNLSFISKVLEYNETLTSLNLTGNKIVNINCLSNMLKKNTSLLSLNLSHNFIEEADEFINSINCNHTLNKLKVLMKYIEDNFKLISTLKNNTSIYQISVSCVDKSIDKIENSLLNLVKNNTNIVKVNIHVYTSILTYWEMHKHRYTNTEYKYHLSKIIKY